MRARAIGPPRREASPVLGAGFGAERRTLKKSARGVCADTCRCRLPIADSAIHAHTFKQAGCAPMGVGRCFVGVATGQQAATVAQRKRQAIAFAQRFSKGRRRRRRVSQFQFNSGLSDTCVFLTRLTHKTAAAAAARHKKNHTEADMGRSRSGAFSALCVRPFLACKKKDDASKMCIGERGAWLAARQGGRMG